jgi:hypothetical protein
MHAQVPIEGLAENAVNGHWARLKSMRREWQAAVRQSTAVLVAMVNLHQQYTACLQAQEGQIAIDLATLPLEQLAGKLMARLNAQSDELTASTHQLHSIVDRLTALLARFERHTRARINKTLAPTERKRRTGQDCGMSAEQQTLLALMDLTERVVSFTREACVLTSSDGR